MKSEKDVLELGNTMTPQSSSETLKCALFEVSKKKPVIRSFTSVEHHCYFVSIFCSLSAKFQFSLFFSETDVSIF